MIAGQRKQRTGGAAENIFMIRQPGGQKGMQK